MQKLFKWLKTIDNNLLKYLLVIFIFFIPLYPKFPLKNVNFTYIAIRLEDLYVSFLVLVFFIQLLRKKIQLKKLFLGPVIIFWVIAFLAFISGLYLTKTIDYPQVGFLHALRRVEYMIVFLIVLSVIKKQKDFLLLFWSLLISLFFVNIYGLGQRFLGWPAVSTMNPEFARGHLLYLTPEARLSSTFAGHYDLAAYLVFLIPIVWGNYFFFLKKSWFITLLPFLSLLILVYTASRTSFIAYIISTPLFLLYLKKYRYFFIVIFASLLLSLFTRDLTIRFLKTIQVKKVLINEKTGQVYIPQKINTKDLPAGSLVVKIQEEKNISKEELKNLKTQLIQEATKSGQISATEAATVAAQLKPVSAITYDISFATRLQVEWPRAIKAFLRNPLLGSGPSSITEATDNDYLRWLGEMGILGFSSFMYLILSLINFIFQKTKKINPQWQPLFYGVIFGTFGLLINALYIDVFEASKVAFVFWYVMGTMVGVLSLPLKIFKSN